MTAVELDTAGARAASFDALIERGEALFLSMPAELRSGLWQAMQAITANAGLPSDRMYARRWVDALDALDGLGGTTARDALAALGPAAAWLLELTDSTSIWRHP
jgi:hypothetical protein